MYAIDSKKKNYYIFPRYFDSQQHVNPQDESSSIVIKNQITNLSH